MMPNSYFLFPFLVFGAGQDIVIQDFCDEDWVNDNGYCYFIVDDKVATKDEAAADCIDRQALLVTIETTDELSFLTDELANFNSDGWWIRLTNVDGKWLWDDSWPADSSVLVWSKEPDNANGKENCVAITEQATFTDEDCNKKYGFICQLQAESCPVGWVDWAQSWCFWVSDTFNATQLMTWKLATEICQSLVQNAQLVSPKNSDILSYMTSSLPEQAQTTLPWWISLNRKGTQWFWGSQTPADAPSMNLITWATEPDNMNGGESCVMFSNGKLADKACNRVANWICKKSDRSVPNSPYDGKFGCGSDWMRAGRKCYYFENHYPKTRDDARQNCLASGGDLLRINTLDERYWADLMCRFYNTGFWTQLRATTIGKNDWKHADGTSPPAGLIVWNKEPNDYNGVEDCIAITPKLTWNDRICRNALGYICEAVSTGGCPAGWVNYGASCYFFGPPMTNATQTMRWMEAQTACKRTAEPLIGTLLVVNDDSELAFVNQELLARQSLGLSHWTALNDFNGEGVFTFADAPMVPVNMDSYPWEQAPSCTTCSPACAAINLGGYFEDFDCGTKRTYACEKYATGLGGAGVLRGGYITVAALVALSMIAILKR